MKRSAILWLAIGMTIELAACTFGNGRICGPQTPQAYCDSEAYQRLAHPKPYLENWEKPGATSNSRAQDSGICGGGTSLIYAPNFSQEQEAAARLPGETDDFKALRRLHLDWQRCMIKKGYRYTGSCSGEYSKASPACGAP